MAVEGGKVASDPEVGTAHSLIPLKLFRFQQLRSVKWNLHKPYPSVLFFDQRHGCNNRFTGGGRDVNANLSDISPNYDTLSLDVGRRAEDMSSPKLAVSSILAIPTGLASVSSWMKKVTGL